MIKDNIKLHFLIYGIKIHDDLSEYSDAASIMKCWVVAENILQAESIVREEITGFNWKILNLIDSQTLTEDDIFNNILDKEYIDFALKNGFRCTINTKPTRK